MKIPRFLKNKFVIFFVLLAITAPFFEHESISSVKSKCAGDNCIQQALQVVLRANIPTQTRLGAFVQLENGNVLYARHNPAKKGMPTVILMNGLPDSLDNWRSMEPDLIEKGYGVIAFDFRGQGNTLAFNGNNFGDLGWRAQVEDVRLLLKFFNVNKVIASGLSYGGGIAIAFGETHPELVDKVIAFAPFVEPVQPQDDQIKQKVEDYLKVHPDANPDEVFADFFRYTVYTTYPLLEPSMLAHPLKPEAVTQMALGIRDFDPVLNIHRLHPNSLTLIGGEFDASVTLSVLGRLWNKTPDSIKQALMVIQTGHRITTWHPEGSAMIIDNVALNPRIGGGVVLNFDEDSSKPFTERGYITPPSKENLLSTQFKLNPHRGGACKNVFH